MRGCPESEQVAHVADREFAAIDAATHVGTAPLAARVKRVKGELLLHNGQLRRARRLLVQAATIFGQHEDWGERAEVLRRLNQAAGTAR